MKQKFAQRPLAVQYFARAGAGAAFSAIPLLHMMIIDMVIIKALTWPKNYGLINFYPPIPVAPEFYPCEVIHVHVIFHCP
jgi:hypothetical protein